MLWVDKYKPKTLSDLSCHPHITDVLKRLVDTQDIPHILFHGPTGSGKKTRIDAFLRAVYGPGVQKVKIDTRTLKVPPSNSTSFETQVVTSSYHLEVSPGDSGNRDRVVVQTFIKEIAQSPPLQTTPSYKVVVINEVDRLTREAQAGLRRTMEKYMESCRILLTCTSLSKVLPPVRSRCLAIRTPAPSYEDICRVLHEVAGKEKIQLPDVLATKIAQHSQRDLRKALLMLETARVQSYPFSESTMIPKAPWEVYIEEITRSIVQEQSPKRLLDVRGKLYDLLTNCIPADLILKTMMTKLLLALPQNSQLKTAVVQYAAQFDHSLRLGSKDVFHLEAFVARTMASLKDSLE
eukprot:GHVL01036477.1.p1 GENE.GHVL01036477.1~~GHVL01036477.1.p1  ORF type:complete len:350 (+),score=44.20 GHVL01036477.1:1422-2471(+)